MMDTSTCRKTSDGHPFITEREPGRKIAKIDGLDLRVGDTFRYYDSYLGRYIYETITAITVRDGRCGDHGTWHCLSSHGITRVAGEHELVLE